MTALGVHSEVGKLREVIVHRPDLSLQRLTPSNHDDLLFDDVLWVERAQYEHDAFVAKMRDRGVEVFYYVELLAEAVAELSGQRRVAARPVRVDARVDAYVPVGYIASEALKIDLHRRLALAENDDELRELHAAIEDRYGDVPEPVENLFRIQDVKLKLATLGADFLVYRGGRASVGQVVLGSGELRVLRSRIDTAVYSSANREVTLRSDSFGGAAALIDAILAARQAA